MLQCKYNSIANGYMEILGVNIATLVKVINKSHHKQCYEDTGSPLMKILCVFSPLPSQLS